MQGLFYENGPFRVINETGDYEIVDAKKSWLEEASMIYLDNPAGTGFSIAQKYLTT